MWIHNLLIPRSQGPSRFLEVNFPNRKKTDPVVLL